MPDENALSGTGEMERLSPQYQSSLEGREKFKCAPEHGRLIVINADVCAHLNDDTAAAAAGTAAVLVNGDIVVKVDLVGEGIHECR